MKVEEVIAASRDQLGLLSGLTRSRPTIQIQKKTASVKVIATDTIYISIVVMRAEGG
jgi:hypothetical protein